MPKHTLLGGSTIDGGSTSCRFGRFRKEQASEVEADVAQEAKETAEAGSHITDTSCPLVHGLNRIESVWMAGTSSKRASKKGPCQGSSKRKRKDQSTFRGGKRGNADVLLKFLKSLTVTATTWYYCASAARPRVFSQHISDIHMLESGAWCLQSIAYSPNMPKHAQTYLAWRLYHRWRKHKL